MITNQTYTSSDYLAAFRRRRRSFLAVAAPVIIISVALSLLLPDQFTSFSRIDIDLEGANVQTLEPIELTRYADQYIGRLKDRALARDNLLALANDSEVFPQAQDELTESDRLDKIGRGIDVSVITQPVLSQIRGREVDLISGLRVAYVDSDPQVALHIADYVAGLFLEADRLSRTERASSTSTFLRKQMDAVERDIVRLENEIAIFKVKNACCLPEIMNLNMTIIQRAERDIENLQPRVRTLQKDRKFLQTQLDEIQRQTVSSDRLMELEGEYLRLVATYGPDYPDLNRVRREISAITNASSGTGAADELAELRLQLAVAEQRYSSEHPDVVRYNREIAALEAQQQLSGRADRTNRLDDPRYLQLRAEINGIDTELIELQTRVPVLRKKIEDYEDRVTRTPQVESEYQAVNRRLATARDNFENLQQRQVIARQTEALEATEIGARLIEVRAASLPRSPSGPPRIAILLIGLFVAGTLGFGLMMIAEMTDTSVRGSKDIAMVMDMLPLATIPVIENSLSQASRHRQVYLISVTVLVATAAIALLYVGNVF